MTSIVCQGMQSRLVEPRILKPKLAPPKPISHHQKPQNENEEENDNNHKIGELGGWSFIKALTNPKQATEAKKVVYVHPLVKRSSFALSKKSLEMCTEGLGSETGSDISESSDELSLISEKFSYPITSSKSRELGGKMSMGGGNFPPPLTSISVYDGVRVRPHREGGRLVIEALNVTSFQAERGDGRLRLCLLKDSIVNCHNEEVYDDFDDDVGDDEDDGDDEEGDYDDDKWDEGVEGDNGNVEGEIANIIELPSCSRPRRCKDSGRGSNNKGMSNWGQFGVAIS